MANRDIPLFFICNYGFYKLGNIEMTIFGNKSKCD